MRRAEPGKTPLQRCTEQSASHARRRGDGSASSGRSPEWMRRAGGGGGREEASAAALRLLLAASSAAAPSHLQPATPSRARPQGELEPTRAPTCHPQPNSCRRALPTRKKTTQVARSKQALGAKNERERKPQSQEVGKPRPGLPSPPHPLAKCVCGWKAGSLRTCWDRRTAAWAAPAR